jgi:hypothetical protein
MRTGYRILRNTATWLGHLRIAASFGIGSDSVEKDFFEIIAGESLRSLVEALDEMS